MTRVVLIMLCGLIFGAPTRSQTKTDLEKEGLRGPVHLVRSQSAQSNEGEERTTPARTKQLDSLTFDQKGRLIERVIYDDYGFLVGTEKYSHNDAGETTTAELVDEKGRLQERRTIVYQQGKLQDVLSYDEKGAVSLKEVHSYDAKGGPLEDSYYSGEKLLGKTVFKTDPDGRVVEAEFFQANGSKAVAPLGPCYSAHLVSYRYGDQGQVTESISYELDGEVKRRSSYRYDEHNNLAYHLRKDDFSTIEYVHAYVYDSHGNWIKDSIKIHSAYKPLIGGQDDNSVRTLITNRQITYY